MRGRPLLRVPSRQMLDPIFLTDFSGGIDMISPPGAMDPRFIRFGKNFTISRTGGLETRLGNQGAGSSLASAGKLIYWSTALDLYFVQRGTGLYSYDGSFNAATLIATFTTSAKCAIIDFGAGIVVAHPVDGIFTYTGAGTWTNRSVTARGNTIAVWQNYVWAAGADGDKVWRSNLGDATVWTTGTDFARFRDVDVETITALHGGSGMDVSGRAGLLVFKATSSYRMNSATAFTYTTIDTKHGAIGSEAVNSIGRLVCCVNTEGVYVTDGYTELRDVSTLVSPLFTFDATSAASPDKWVVARSFSKFYISWPRWAYWIEFDPQEGWMMLHTHGAGSNFISATVRAEVTDQPVVLNSDTTNAYYLGGGATTDGGVNIGAELTTAWIPLSAGALALIQRIEVVGRSRTTGPVLVLRTDFDEDIDIALGTLSDLVEVASVTSASTRIHPNTPARYVALNFTHANANRASNSPNYDFASSNYVPGGLAISSIRIDPVPLGFL